MTGSKVNPMNGCVFPNARQCSARSKRTACQCRAPAMAGSNVCRFHGARGGQPSGAGNPRFSHGFHTPAEVEYRRLVRQLIRTAKR